MNKFLFLVTIMSFNLSCQTKIDNKDQNNQEEEYLNGFREYFPIVNKYKNWRVRVIDESIDMTNLHISTYDSDTLIAVELYKYKAANTVHYELAEVMKIFNREKNFIDFQSLDKDMHLMFWYKYRKDNEDDRTFIMGKYNFLYLKGGLNEKQDMFFKSHSDSLTKVRGNDLPSLPEK